MINIYVSVSVMGDVNNILGIILKKIDESGLYEACNKIYLIVNGDMKLLNIDLSKDKYFILNPNDGVEKCEFPALNFLLENTNVSKSNDYILYLHTKGVSRNSPNIQDWINYMFYFNVDKWKDRILELESNDCTGVNLNGKAEDIKLSPYTWGYGKAPIHYSGNFWWSKSQHIKKLPNPINWMPSENYLRLRVMCEMWLCQIADGKYHEVWQSGIDHYNSPYPKKLYEKNNI